MGLDPWNGSCVQATRGLAGTPAMFDAESGTFQKTLTIKDKVSYCIKPFTITSGPRKGQHVLLLEPAGNFRFLDLPREVRDLIYGLVVVLTAPVTLKIFMAARRTDKSSVTKSYDPATKKWKHLVRQRVVQESVHPATRIAHQSERDGATSKWKFRNSDVLNLLLVNRQVSDEAAKLLYGGNEFSFKLPVQLSACLEVTVCASRLTSVTICALSLDFIKASVAAGLLQTLRLASLHANITAPAIVEACLPLLERLAISRKARGVDGSVADVVQIIGRPYYDRPGTPIGHIPTFVLYLPFAPLSLSTKRRQAVGLEVARAVQQKFDEEAQGRD